MRYYLIVVNTDRRRNCMETGKKTDIPDAATLKGERYERPRCRATGYPLRSQKSIDRGFCDHCALLYADIVLREAKNGITVPHVDVVDRVRRIKAAEKAQKVGEKKKWDRKQVTDLAHALYERNRLL
jgi:hypothetical protein